MKEIREMLHAEVLAELEALNEQFTAADLDRLEGELRLRAYVLGWTGDPLRQPPRAVLAAARAIKTLPPDFKSECSQGVLRKRRPHEHFVPYGGATP